MNQLLARALSLAALIASLCSSSLALGDVFSNVPGLSGYNLVYTSQLPTSGARFNATGAPYAVNNAAAFTTLPTRVGYYLELDADALGSGAATQYVYVEFDRLSGMTNYQRLGIPTTGALGGTFFQENLANGRVVSNVAGVTNGTGLSTLNIEFWPSNYGGNNDDRPASPANANDGLFDFGDGGSSGSAGHGSMQIHNRNDSGAGGAGRTIIGFSDWGGNNQGSNLELGIGNRPTSQPDWTFSDSAGSYAVKNLQVVVNAAPVAPADTSSVAGAPASAAAFVPAAELDQYRLAYHLSVPNDAAGSLAYAVNNTASLPAGSFDRVAYYLELDTGSGPQRVWISADAFNADATKLGVPTTASGEFYQHILSDANVFSNVASLAASTGVGLSTINMEFFPTNYDAPNGLGAFSASGTTHDFGDRPNAGNYSSMQIHNFGTGTTLMAYNNWNGAAGNSDLGIGNNPSGSPDWTFTNNAATYTLKNLYVLVHGLEAELSEVPPDGSTFSFETQSLISALLSDAVSLSNTGDANTVLNVTGFSITGADSAYFDVPDFVAAALVAGGADNILYDVEFLGGNFGQTYNATLTFNTSAGNVSYGLVAAVTPEPASVVAWSLGLLVVGGAIVWQRKRCRRAAV